eukprot:2217219-Amphidinium_carterae.1
MLLVLQEYIPMLTVRIRVQNQSVRQLVLEWLMLMDSNPKVLPAPAQTEVTFGWTALLTFRIFWRDCLAFWPAKIGTFASVGCSVYRLMLYKSSLQWIKMLLVELQKHMALARHRMQQAILKSVAASDPSAWLHCPTCKLFPQMHGA